jgi:Asp/Glu/hydantoin racemase
MHAGVGFLRQTEADNLARTPRPASVHAGVDATGGGGLARIAEILYVVLGVPVRGAIERSDINT